MAVKNEGSIEHRYQARHGHRDISQARFGGGGLVDMQGAAVVLADGIAWTIR